jgi:hypothetical protein
MMGVWSKQGYLRARDAPKGKRPKGLLDLLFSKALLNTL